MAFVALDKDETELYGVARLAADPDYTMGEYAIIVRSDLKGKGIGWILMRHLIRYAEHEGLNELSGDVLVNNTACWRCAKRWALRSAATRRMRRCARSA